MSQARISMTEDKNFQQVPWPILPILILVIATRITNEEAWALGSHCITSQISDEKAQVVKKSIAELVIKHKQK